MRASQLVVDHRLSASLDARDIVAHRVHAGLAGVDLDDNLEGRLAALKLFFPVLTIGLAFLQHLRLGIHAFLKLRVDEALELIVIKVRGKVRPHLHPAGRQPSCDSASHFLSLL